uniref:Transmembrane protein 33-like n=1 Tax=Sinocyclocheilus anshuiensis TaxID=1608454 RepID=A0A671KWT2_9TELE
MFVITLTRDHINVLQQFLLSNKLETAMWLSRLFTVYCSIMFILPLLGPQAATNFYQRALLANALTSALRLHQRLPHFQLSRAFLAQALQEDSCHYLLYSLILVNSYPITMSIFPVFLFSLLHATTYTKKVLDTMGPNSLMFVRNFLNKLTANQQNILKFIACNEIFLMPATVFMLFRVSFISQLAPELLSSVKPHLTAYDSHSPL